MCEATAHDTGVEREYLETEVRKLIGECLEISVRVGEEDNMANELLGFLDGCSYSVSLATYPHYASLVLSLLASEECVRNLMRKGMGEDEYYGFCRMLRRLIEFCVYIRNNDVAKFRIDQAKWTVGRTEEMSLNEIVLEKMFYTAKLEHLKALFLHEKVKR